MKHRMFMASSALLLITGCGASGGSEGATTTTKAKAATTTEVEATTTTEVEELDGAVEFQKMVEDMDAAIDEEAVARDEAAAENDLETAVGGISELRDQLYDFDGDLRDLSVADEAVESVNAVLEADSTYIEHLDEFNGITDIPRYNDLLEEEPDVREDWEKAVNDAAEAFGVDGIEEGLSGAEGGDDPDEPTGTTEPTRLSNAGTEAGGEVTDGSVTMTVPEGFTGSGEGPLTMSGPDGATLGVYGVSGEEGEDLATVAKEFVEGSADKNGYEITGGPEDTPVGDVDGVAYYYEYEEGDVSYDVFFENDGEFYVLNLRTSPDQAEELVAAVTEALDTIEFE